MMTESHLDGTQGSQDELRAQAGGQQAGGVGHHHAQDGGEEDDHPAVPRGALGSQTPSASPPRSPGTPPTPTMTPETSPRGRITLTPLWKKRQLSSTTSLPRRRASQSGRQQLSPSPARRFPITLNTMPNMLPVSPTPGEACPGSAPTTNLMINNHIVPTLSPIQQQAKTPARPSDVAGKSGQSEARD